MGGPAPDFELNSLEGESHGLSDYRGDMVILNLLSTACPVCMDELAHLKGVNEEFGDHVVIMTIPVDPSDTTEDMECFRDSYGGDWIYGMKPSIGTDYYVQITPAVFVVDNEASSPSSTTRSRRKRSLSPRSSRCCDSMDLSLLALAVSAGVASFFNPCSFALLPAYLSYFLGREEKRSPGSYTDNALLGIKYGLLATLGFAAVFLSIGVLVSLVGSQIRPFLPPIMLVVGIVLIILGILWAMDRPVLYLTPLLGKVGMDQSSFFLFGVAYAIGSIACVFPIFLMLVFSALSTGGFLSGTFIFLVYTLSMGMMMVIVSLAMAPSKKVLMQRFRAARKYVTRASGIILLAAGLYIVYYYLANYA
ncbi:MAG: cytochrome c biogenesis protein CcdA [Methanomassiliicoccales archaeon]